MKKKDMKGFQCVNLKLPVSKHSQLIKAIKPKGTMQEFFRKCINKKTIKQYKNGEL